MGSRDPKKFPAPVGPCITGIIDMRGESTNVMDGYVIQEGVCPAALVPVYWLQVKTLARLIGKAPPLPFSRSLRRIIRGFITFVRGAYHGSLANSQVFLIMGYDAQQGCLALVDDRLKISFKNAGRNDKVKELNKVLERFSHVINGTFVPSPLWDSGIAGQTMLTVHPVGGCAMGRNARKGVVNHKGQVRHIEYL